MRLSLPGLLVLAVTLSACATVPEAGSVTAPGVHTGQATANGHTLGYRLVVPERNPGDPAPPLLMLLHGCTQDAEDVARGTRMDVVANELGVAVLYPEQAEDAHPLRCWNWYLPEHQRRNSGELRVLAAMAEEVSERIGSDPARFYVGGISAGAATALAFAAAYPERVAAVAVHSGIPYGAARSEEEALAAMAAGPALRGDLLAERVLDAMGVVGRAVPLIVFHGADDPVVHRLNGAAVLEQWAEVHAILTGAPAVIATRTEMREGRAVEITSASHGDGARIDLWMIEELGHAWSGGSAEGSYTDPEGPDASREMLRFLLSHRNSR